MAAHNYDGDMLTDEVAQVHRSPGFITSNLIGKAADGRLIKEFEASHGALSPPPPPPRRWASHRRLASSVSGGAWPPARTTHWVARHSMM